MKKKTELLAELAAKRPEVSVDVTWERAPFFVWDGDGPDPINEGFFPHDVTVTASAMSQGKLLRGRTFLGGSYAAPGDECPEVHGYFPKLLEEALDDLGNEITRWQSRAR